MRRRAGPACIALLTLLAAVPSGAVPDLGFHKSYALVVGIDRYPSPAWEDLAYAVADAQAVAEFLRDQGFEVKLLTDAQATREAIVEYFEDQIGHTLGPSDRVIFFFAGHGHTEHFAGGEERGYVVPYDGKDKSSSYLSMSRIRDLSEILAAARHQLFIMDSCYGGRLGMRGNGDSLDPRLPSYLEEVKKRKARQILTAGGATQRVQDLGSDGHSVFTAALLNALRDGEGDTNGDGFVTFYELSTYLQLAAHTDRQTPGVDFLPGHAQGEFLFWKPGAQTVLETPQSGGEASGPTRGPSAYALLQEGKSHFLQKDFEAALPLFSEAADLGNVEAMFLAGLVSYKLHPPGSAESEQALEQVRESARRGHVQAMQSLVTLYRSTDPDEADRWQGLLDEANQITRMATLVDPTGTAASTEVSVPESELKLSPPTAPILLP